MRSWFAVLCLATALLQAVYAAVRVIISYNALELADSTVVGILTAAYSLIPLLVAIPIGRMVDGAHASAVLRVGAVVTVVAVGLVLLGDSIALLAAGSVLLGTGHMLTIVSGQGYIPLKSPPGQYDRQFAGLTLWVSVGQFAGIPLVGLLSTRDSTGHVDTSLALTAAAALAVLAAGVCTAPALRCRVQPTAAPRPPVQSTRSMLSTTGMRPAIYSSLVVLASLDVTTAYLPVLGEQHGFSVMTVTAILTARAAAAMVSRVLLTRMLGVVPRPWLLVSGTLCSAVPIALVPAFPHPVVTGSLMAAAGFFWGLAQPLTMTWVTGLVAPTDRASALSLRITGNRIGQVAIPLAAAVASGPAGTGTVFVLTAGLLAGAAVSTWRAVIQ